VVASLCVWAFFNFLFISAYNFNIWIDRPSRSEDNKQGDGRNSERQALKVGKQLGRLFIPHTQTFIRRKHYRIKETA